LYRGVIDALYKEPPDFRNKSKYLSRLQRDGWWLLDAVSTPINHLSGDRAKRAAIRAAGPKLISRLRDEGAAPVRGVVVCLVRVYEEIADQLAEAGIRILHDEPLPFPGRPEHRARFVKGLRHIASSLG